MRKEIKSLTELSLTCALMCISANLYIPLAVPVTLQILVLYFSLFLFGGRRTLFATLAYVTLGAIGLPVFSGFSGGIGRLLDATGGYILGMLLAVLVWWLLELLVADGKLKVPLLCTVSLTVIYAVGAVFYAAVYLGSIGYIGEAVLVGVLPFVVPDIIKICIAYILSKRLKPIIKGL